VSRLKEKVRNLLCGYTETHTNEEMARALIEVACDLLEEEGGRKYPLEHFDMAEIMVKEYEREQR
jgi:hypothetical protein